MVHSQTFLGSNPHFALYRLCDAESHLPRLSEMRASHPFHSNVKCANYVIGKMTLAHCFYILHAQ